MSCIYCGNNNPDEIFKIKNSDSYCCDDCSNEYYVEFDSGSEEIDND